MLCSKADHDFVWLRWNKQKKEMEMGSIHWQMKALRQNWDKEKFRNLHHEDFLFIRETELLNHDDHMENI